MQLFLLYLSTVEMARKNAKFKKRGRLLSEPAFYRKSYSRPITLNATIRPENTMETVEHSLIRMFRLSLIHISEPTRPY